MKFTENDAMFAVLHSCADGLRSDRLVYYMYAFQKAGLSLKYRYRVQANGLMCRAVAAELNKLVMQNKIACEDGVLCLTDEGYLYYDNVVMTAREWDIVDGVIGVLSSLSVDELFFVCLTDIMLCDMLKRSGVDGLLHGRETIERTLQTLCKEYSADNFNTALSLMRQIGEGDFAWKTTSV